MILGRMMENGDELLTINGGFQLVMGVPKNGAFIMEKPIEMRMIWGYPYFRQPPNRDTSSK